MKGRGRESGGLPSAPGRELNVRSSASNARRPHALHRKRGRMSAKRRYRVLCLSSGQQNTDKWQPHRTTRAVQPANSASSMVSIVETWVIVAQ